MTEKKKIADSADYFFAMKPLEAPTGQIFSLNSTKMKKTINKICDKWSTSPSIQLHAGEMTAQELRSVKAVVSAIRAEMLAEMEKSV